jgi:hypothetical protein
LNRVNERNTIVCQSDNWTYATYEEKVEDVLAVYSASFKMSADFTDFQKANKLFSSIEQLQQKVFELETNLNGLNNVVKNKISDK